MTQRWSLFGCQLQLINFGIWAVECTPFGLNLFKLEVAIVDLESWGHLTHGIGRAVLSTYALNIEYHLARRIAISLLAKVVSRPLKLSIRFGDLNDNLLQCCDCRIDNLRDECALSTSSDARRIYRSNSIQRDVGKGDEFHNHVFER